MNLVTIWCAICSYGFYREYLWNVSHDGNCDQSEVGNSSHTISSLMMPKDAAMQVDIGLPYLEDSDVKSSECSDIDSDEQMC